MNREKIVEGLKRVLEELGVEYSRILLFGSRARGHFREESDWDFVIILKKKVSDRERMELGHRIYRKFHELFPFVSVDIILKDEDSFEKEKRIANTISNEAFLEGVAV